MDDRDDVKPDCRPVYRWTADSRLLKAVRCEPAAERGAKELRSTPRVRTAS